MARTMSRPVPSGSWRSVTTTCGLVSSYALSACVTLAASPTTVMPSSRPNAPTRPWRMSSWSSTTRTRTSPSVVVAFMRTSLTSAWESRRQDTPHAERLDRHAARGEGCGLGGGVAHAHRKDRAARVALLHVEAALDEPGPLGQDLEAM